MSLDKLTTAVSPADVAVATDVAGLTRLKAAARERSPEALEAVAKQFESLFLEMMLKSMREASLGDGLFDSQAGDLYQGMFDKQIALDMARGKGLGIADLLMRQLAPPNVRPSPEGPIPLQAPPGQGLPIQAPRLPTLPIQPPAASATGSVPATRAPDWRPESPEEFVREILPHARKAAEELGINPLGIVAQAALETGWGRNVVARADGGSSFNLFGIKAGQSWQGERAASSTIEFEGGVAVRRQQSFRSYASVADSFADYVKLLGGNPRYREVLESGTEPAGFASALGRSGYATDPQYASKIRHVLDSEPLREASAALKNRTTGPI